MTSYSLIFLLFWMPSLDNYSEKSRGMRNTLSCRETFQIILCEPALASLSLELSFGKFSCIASRPKHHNFKFHVLDFSIFPTKFFLFLMELTFYPFLCFLMSLEHVMTAYRYYPALLSVLSMYRSTFCWSFVAHPGRDVVLRCWFCYRTDIRAAFTPMY